MTNFEICFLITFKWQGSLIAQNGLKFQLNHRTQEGSNIGL